MITQTVFKAGNSQVVSIPKTIAREINLQTGDKVILSETPDKQGIFIKKHNSSQKTPAANKEFKKWLKKVLKEDKQLLHELSLR